MTYAARTNKSPLQDGLERIGLSFVIALTLQCAQLIAAAALPAYPVFALSYRLTVLMALGICLAPGILLLRMKYWRAATGILAVGIVAWLASMYVSGIIVVMAFGVGGWW